MNKGETVVHGIGCPGANTQVPYCDVSKAFAWGTSSTFVYTTTGLGVGTTTPSCTIHAATSITTSPRGIMSSQHNDGTHGSMIQLRKTRGTNATQTLITSGDILGTITSSGMVVTGTAEVLDAARIDFVSVGTIATTRLASEIQFWTTPDTAPSTVAQRMVINSAGFVGINNSLPLYNVDLIKDAIGATIGTNKYGIALRNTTAATAVSTIEVSPAVFLQGSSWNTTTSLNATQIIRMNMLPRTGVTASCKAALFISASADGGTTYYNCASIDNATISLYLSGFSHNFSPALYIAAGSTLNLSTISGATGGLLATGITSSPATAALQFFGLNDNTGAISVAPIQFVGGKRSGTTSSAVLSTESCIEFYNAGAGFGPGALLMRIYGNADSYWTGQNAVILAMNRHTTADTAGNKLTICAGGCTSTATNKTGGTLYLSSGIGRGTTSGYSDVIIQTATNINATDNAPVDKFSVISRSLVDNNMQYAGAVPQTTGSFYMLTASKAGMGFISWGDGAEYAWFSFTSAAVVTLVTNSANVVNVQLDARVNIIDGGTSVYIINEMGATTTMTVTIIYNQ